MVQQLRNDKKGYSLAEQYLGDFDVCHHCKHLFSKESLSTCKSKGKKKHPSMIKNDPYLYSLYRHSQDPNESLCHRSYCHNCLRNNYD